MIDDRLIDQAKVILAEEPALDDSDRTNLWDHYYLSRDAQELSVRLADVDAPMHVLESLVEAKRRSEPKAPVHESDAMDRTIAALAKLKTIDERALALAERHPCVMRLLANAAA